MTDREDALRKVGVELYEAPRHELTAFGAELNGFSGYGEFTPITIRSYTVPEDADLERNQPRN